MKALVAWLAWLWAAVIILSVTRIIALNEPFLAGFVLAAVLCLPGAFLLWIVPTRHRAWQMALGAGSGLLIPPVVGMVAGYAAGHGGGTLIFAGLALAVPCAIGGAIAGQIFSGAEKRPAPATSGDGWWPAKRE